MSFIEMLKKDHKYVIDELTAIGEQEEIKKSDAKEVIAALQLHMELEEKFLYPEMLKFEESKEMSQEASLEHEEAKKVIDDILHDRLSELKLKVKLELLKGDIEHHVEEEEKELFPSVKKLLSKEQIDAITEKMEAFRAKNSDKEPAEAK